MATSSKSCDFCSKVTQWIVSPDRHPPDELGGESCNILKESAATCDMCEVIMKEKIALDQDPRVENPGQIPISFDITRKLSRLSGVGSRICCVEVRCEYVQVPWEFAFWADKGE
jgi:hypothetical protein